MFYLLGTLGPRIQEGWEDLKATALTQYHGTKWEMEVRRWTERRSGKFKIYISMPILILFFCYKETDIHTPHICSPNSPFPGSWGPSPQPIPVPVAIPTFWKSDPRGDCLLTPRVLIISLVSVASIPASLRQRCLLQSFLLEIWTLATAPEKKGKEVGKSM